MKIVQFPGRGADTAIARIERNRSRSERKAEVVARRVIETYLATRRHPGGFALDPLTGEFISPHVYLAARTFLHQVGDA